ncbi:MAG: hypothetical protein OEQ18_09345 [Gammaproteobacteria bacterium]|nr:hypothetical protein [Gammaproteobacteria bacterium]
MSAARAIQNPHDACSPQICSGLVSFENIATFLQRIETAERAGHLAFRTGLGLLLEGCCFSAADGYLGVCIAYRPPPGGNIYDTMNKAVNPENWTAS